MNKVQRPQPNPHPTQYPLNGRVMEWKEWNRQIFLYSQRLQHDRHRDKLDDWLYYGQEIYFSKDQAQ